MFVKSVLQLFCCFFVFSDKAEAGERLGAVLIMTDRI
jgi:hypothetical protein